MTATYRPPAPQPAAQERAIGEEAQGWRGVWPPSHLQPGPRRTARLPTPVRGHQGVGFTGDTRGCRERNRMRSRPGSDWVPSLGCEIMKRKREKNIDAGKKVKKERKERESL